MSIRFIPASEVQEGEPADFHGAVFTSVTENEDGTIHIEVSNGFSYDKYADEYVFAPILDDE